MNKFIGKIYIHKNKLNGKCYVGQTTWKPASKRWGKNGIQYRPETIFGKAISKYGWDNFEHIVMPQEYNSPEELNKAEIEMIKELDSFYNGYNMTTGGDMFIKSKEVGSKISKSKMGHHVSEETREKLRKANLGKKVSEETRIKMIMNNKRTKHTELSKKKLRDTHKKVKVDKFDLEGNYIKTYECLSDIQREFGKDVRSNIKKNCNNQIKSVYGFVWKYNKTA